MFYLLTKAIKVFPPWHVGISAFLVNFSDLFICKQFAYLLMVSAWLNMPNTRSHISTPCETITFWNAIKCPVFPGKTRCGFQASQLCVWYLSINIKKRKRGKQNETVTALNDLGNLLTPWLATQKTCFPASSQVYLQKCEKMLRKHFLFIFLCAKSEIVIVGGKRKTTLLT